jgi:hypothetical protein
MGTVAHVSLRCHSIRRFEKTSEDRVKNGYAVTVAVTWARTRGSQEQLAKKTYFLNKLLGLAIAVDCYRGDPD